MQAIYLDFFPGPKGKAGQLISFEHECVIKFLKDSFKAYLVETVEFLTQYIKVYEVFRNALEKSDVKRIGELLQNGADINCIFKDKKYEGMTPLAVASLKGNIPLAGYLLGKGALIDYPLSKENQPIQHSWYTPLMYASCNGDTRMMEFLLNRGADINIQNYKGPVLCHAAECGKPEAIMFLIDKGADYKKYLKIEPRGKDICSLLEYAIESGNMQVIKYIVSLGAKITAYALGMAVEKSKDIVIFFLNKGGNINGHSVFGETVLHRAAKNGDLTMIQFLFEKGAKIKKKYDPITAIGHKLPAEIQIAIAGLFLKKGSDINSQDADGRTVLVNTLFTKQTGFIRFLLEQGADPGIKDKWGKDAMKWAREYGNSEIVDLVKKYI